MIRLYFLSACHALLLLLVASDVTVLANETESTLRWAAAPARLYEAKGVERRLLDRFQRYLDRAQWDDAFECAARLLQKDSTTVVAVGDHRYVSSSEYVHLQLAKLPVEAIGEYRGMVDSLAEAWYQRGIADRNERLLRQVVDELFCSRWGDEALYALGELALEQGEHQAARRYWSRISQKLQFPNKRNPDEQLVLAYPDTNISLADVRARLALVSLYEGDLARAKKEIEALALNHGQAIGRLGGQEVVLAEALAAMLQQAGSWPPLPASSDWPTYAGSPARTSSRLHGRRTNYKKLWSQSFTDVFEVDPHVFPIVLGKLLLYQNTSQVEALQLATGERVFVSAGATFQSSAIEENGLGSPCYTLSGIDPRVFGTTAGPLVKRRAADKPRGSATQWGIDLRRDGALIFQHTIADGNAARVGAPVVVGDRLWVAMQSGGPTARAGIACYDLAIGEQVWQRWYCRSNTPATNQFDEYATNLLTYDSGVVYCCTNLGAVVAIRADDGRPLWITMYDRSSAPPASADVHPYYRSPNPSVFFRGMLFVLPTDSQELLALDAATGIVRWRYKIISPVSQILGVTDNSLLLSDEGFRTFDLRTGEPKASVEKLRLLGNPVVVGETIYWPNERTILAVDIASGELADKTLQLPESGGANLLVAGEYMVAAGPSQLTVYQADPLHVEPSEPSQVSQNP